MTDIGGLLARVLPLALGAAVSPTILIVNLVILSSRRHPRARSAAFSAGATAVLVVWAVLSFSVIRPVAHHRATSSPLYGWIDLAFALLLVGLGLRNLSTPPRPPRPRATDPDDAARVGRFVLLGIGMMLTNFTTLVLFLPLVREIVVSDVATTAKIVVAAVSIAVVTVVAWGPLLATVVWRERADRALGALNAAITRHQRTIGALVAIAFGVYLAIKGFREL
jgi:hypothetical protein